MLFVIQAFIFIAIFVKIKAIFEKRQVFFYVSMRVVDYCSQVQINCEGQVFTGGSGPLVETVKPEGVHYEKRIYGQGKRACSSDDS